MRPRGRETTRPRGRKTMKTLEQGNDWLKFWNENQKSLFQAWAEGKPPPFASMGQQPSNGNAIADLMQRSMEQWTSYAKNAWTQTGRFDAESMKKLFDPDEWKRASSLFDIGLEKLTEGPTYATLWDLDRKMLNVQKLWIERGRDAEQYWEVVQGAWNRALEHFTNALNDSKAEPITSGRQMLDLWLATANTSLVEMHRSGEFLEAQRRMTRSSTEYRLAEREIAEGFCEMHHIPTRTEMDEMQRSVTELRRELRSLKRHASEPVVAAANPVKKPVRKPAGRKKRK
jgi:poly[(R)-3-hydroxyalkanoate] polymerase subunit PhaE